MNQSLAEFVEELSEGIPETYNRLENDSEWSVRKDQWTFPHQIVGAFAMWACRQSPYGVPDGLENVCKYLTASLKSVTEWSVAGMSECSLCDINRWLHEILMEQGVKDFDAWNERKNGRDGIGITSAFDQPHPDDDFIDLSALLHNVCITIRDERRQNAEFDRKFEAEYGPLSTPNTLPEP